MKAQLCQTKSDAKSWDDLIDFAKAKLKEMQLALKYFETSKKRGDPFILSQADGK
jgi:hypothetical protein